MALIKMQVVVGIQCDKKLCTAEIRAGEKLIGGAVFYRKVARENGWSVWNTNGGANRFFCPTHGPSMTAQLTLCTN